MIYYDFYSSPLGNVTLESDGENLTELYIDGQRQVNDDYYKTAKRQTLPIFSQTVKWLDEYFDGKTPDYPLRKNRYLRRHCQTNRKRKRLTQDVSTGGRRSCWT